MDMAMLLLYSSDDKAMTMVLDRMQMSWQENLLIDAGSTQENETTPTPQPTPVPTPQPSNITTTSAPSPTTENGTGVATEQTFYFSNISMYLIGATAFTDQARVAFEEATEAFYNSYYQTGTTNQRRDGRLLESVDVGNFSTDVSVKGESVNNEGNTVFYDQSINFVSDQSEGLSPNQAKELLTVPMSTQELRDDYFDKLMEKNQPVFADVTKVDSPVVPLPREESSGTDEEDDNKSVVVATVVSVLAVLCFCCVGGVAGAYYYKSRSAPQLVPTTETEDEPNRSMQESNPNRTLEEQSQNSPLTSWNDSEDPERDVEQPQPQTQSQGLFGRLHQAVIEDQLRQSDVDDSSWADER
ncbi:hypothetical protein ACA910_021525 [Epithemia clementina (nom. ined.)]